MAHLLSTHQTTAQTPLVLTIKPGTRSSASGFSLVEMLVAITVTLIIMGSVYGLISQGQNAFGREPLVADRQQQLRLAMDRIQKDIVSAGLGLGPYVQAFEPALNGLGPLGVAIAAVNPAFPSLGGGQSDVLEIRSQSPDCALIRTVPGPVGPPAAGTALVGTALQTVDTFPAAPSACFQTPGWVFLLYPNGWSKYGWLSNIVNNASTFVNPQPDGSQINATAVPAHVLCSIWFGNQNNLASPNNPGPTCTVLPPLPPPLPPPFPAATPDPQALGGCPSCDPYAIAQADFIRYQIGFEPPDPNHPSGVITLYRSTTGGIDLVGGIPTATNPPGNAWQAIARGIEDFQVEYRTQNSTAAGAPNDWLANAPLITNGTLAGQGNIVQELRVTLWSRVVTDRDQFAGNPSEGLTGESRAAGNQVMAMRGSFTSRIAPRAGQEALLYSGQWR